MLAARLLPCLAMLWAIPAHAFQIDIAGPPNSVAFGAQVLALPNGNFIVTDPDFSLPGLARIGAVHLYAADGRHIRTLTGSQADDRVGNGGVRLLATGHVVVRSPYWSNGAAARAGAVTWINTTTGLAGEVSPANSLVGSSTEDYVGSYGVFPLSTGHYVVVSTFWDGEGATDVGAVTWGNGNGGTVGTVSGANSLVGSSEADRVGNGRLVPLGHGDYVVSSPDWDRGAVTDAGAVTWCSGSGGCTGVVGSGNSLVGSKDDDAVGQVTGPDHAVVALDTGHYVVASDSWDSPAFADVGAVTWGNGFVGTTGAVGAGNSLLGSRPGDRVGKYGVIALSNGHYVVNSPEWDASSSNIDVGAITWGDGDVGTVGSVQAGNSLIGNLPGDFIGDGGVEPLANGNYVVLSEQWGVTDVGAVTWVDGAGPHSGVVSSTNSRIGNTADDLRFAEVVALTNGHYVVRASGWDNGAVANVGAVFWSNGALPSVGQIEPGMALIGATEDDHIGSSGVEALSNGHYVVSSPQWDNGPILDVGAVTWRNGTLATSAVVSAGNSMIGSSGDHVGSGGVTALDDGRYVIGSPAFNDGLETNIGAITELNGNLMGLGTVGMVSEGNSLVGSADIDQIGMYVVAAPKGSYVTLCGGCDLTLLFPDSGAIIWGHRDLPRTGRMSEANSVRGRTAEGGVLMDWSHDANLDRLIVGRPAENLVTLLDTSLFRDSFE